MSAPSSSQFANWQRASITLGLAGLAAWGVGAIFAHRTALQSYWFAWIFWSGLGFGALSMLMMQFLTGGAWGEAVRPSAQAAALTIPVMGLLLLPVFFAMSDVFPWAHQHALIASAPHKRAYLRAPWFIARAVVYFIVLGGLAGVLRLSSPASVHHTAVPASAAGIIIYGACMLFASTDWVMSLEPQWFSTMLVVIVMAWQFLAALALSVIVVTLLARTSSPAPATTKQLHDLGNLLLAFVTFWIYVSFGQFLIIWSGNLPREISWYLNRGAGGWQYVAAAVALLQFGLPFALLLSRARKRLPERLLPIAALILLASVLNVFWMIVPSFRPAGFQVHWLDVVAFIGLGGVWLSTFLGFARGRLSALSVTSEEVARG